MFCPLCMKRYKRKDGKVEDANFDLK
jgi:hypothetical protein